MYTNFPLVSIIIPTYNQADYLIFSIESCLKQTYKNIEVIVIDDGCTDNTSEILDKYSTKIKIIKQNNQGAAMALNNGIKIASGSLIGWLSSDDAYLPYKIEYQVKQFIDDPLLDVSYTDWYSIDKAGNILLEVKSPHYTSNFLQNFLFGNFINGSSVIMKKTVWEEVGGFNTALVADVDGYMWYSLLLKGKSFGHIPKTLIYYRTHSQNQSSNMPLMRFYSDKVICEMLQKIPDNLLNPNNGTQGIYIFYKNYIKHLHKCFFWNSALLVSTRMYQIKPSILNKLHISIIKLLIKIFEDGNYSNFQIRALFRLRSIVLKSFHKKKN